MDTDLSINSALVNQIRGEILPGTLLEGFLEAAPQTIFQLSLVLENGYFSKFINQNTVIGTESVCVSRDTDIYCYFMLLSLKFSIHLDM